MPEPKTAAVKSGCWEENPTPHKKCAGLTGAAHKLMLFGLGAMDLAQQEIEDLAARLIERGEMVERESREAVSEAKARRKKTAAAAPPDPKPESTANLRQVMPSRADLAELDKKIAELTLQIEELDQPIN
jgi:polyhydroxyalkanoate synthesis regulator phasin